MLCHLKQKLHTELVYKSGQMLTYATMDLVDM